MESFLFPVGEDAIGRIDRCQLQEMATAELRLQAARERLRMQHVDERDRFDLSNDATIRTLLT